MRVDAEDEMGEVGKIKCGEDFGVQIDVRQRNNLWRGCVHR